MRTNQWQIRHSNLGIQTPYLSLIYTKSNGLAPALSKPNTQLEILLSNIAYAYITHQYTYYKLNINLK